LSASQSSISKLGRGGAGFRGFDYGRVKDMPAFPEIGLVSESEMWSRLLDKLFARRKVPIQGSWSDARPFGDVIQAGVCTRLCKSLLPHLEDPLAVPLCVVRGFRSLDFLRFVGSRYGNLDQFLGNCVERPLTVFRQVE
jgi:hypothetical protein